MALASSVPAPPTFTASQGESNPSDPFYKSTPRTNSSSLATLMSAVQQVAPAPGRATPAPSFRMSRYASGRRPQCTHMMMSRVHGDDLICGMCGRNPDFGWLYQCRQDEYIQQDTPLPDIDSPPVVPDSSDYFDAKARVAEYLQMSPSVINGIRNGDYDVDQVDKLIAQKEKVISVIIEKASRSDENVPPSVRSSFNAQNVISSVGSSYQAPYQNCRTSIALPAAATSTPANAPGESKAITPTKQDSVLSKRSQGKCRYQVCHGCRPYFGDRAYASFETVLNSEPALDDLKGLPIMDAKITRTIGLKQPPPPILRSFQSQQSMDITIYESTTDASTQISLDWTPTNTNVEDEMQLDSAELFPCPGPLHCPVWSRQSGCAYDAGFDDGKRAENHGFLSRVTPENSMSHLLDAFHGTPGETSSTASSISLPTPNRSPLTPLLPTDETFDVALQRKTRLVGKANSVCGELSGENRKIGLRRKHSTNSFGSEVEVEGGVALTEEAVQDRVPDIVNDE